MSPDEPGVLFDPEIDPLATYVLEPDDLRALCARVVVASGHATHTGLAPFTGAPVAAVPTSTPQDVAGAARRVRAAQRRWAARPARERGRVLLALHDLLLARQSDGLDLVQVETGAARAHAFAELLAVAQQSRRLGAAAGGLLRAHGPVGGRLGRTRVQVQPAGIVVVVGSPAVPLASTLGELLAPLLVGDGVLLHPDEQSTVSALWALEVAVDAGVPADLVQVLTGGPEVATALVEVADRLVVTASTATVRDVWAAAAARRVPVTSASSAPNPAYVGAGSDARASARALARACFGPAGPGGSAVDRVLVHEAVWDEVLAELVAATAALRLDPGLHYRGDVGVLRSAGQLANVVEQVGDAVDLGARVLVGGLRLEHAGPWAYAPTILADVPASARLATQASAGPVVQIAPVAGDDAAVAAMNATGRARCARLWTGRTGRALAARVQADVVEVGDPTLAGVRTGGGAPVPGPTLAGAAGVGWAGRTHTVVAHGRPVAGWDVELGAQLWADVLTGAEHVRRALRLG